MKQLGYNPIGVITDTWEHARFLNKNFNAEFGIVALEKFCELEPDALSAEEEEFCRPSTYADFVENIIQILGPDIEFIMSIMAGIAKTFQAQGGKAEYMLSIGDSLVYSVEKCLDRHLNEEEIEAFDEVFNAICREICKNLKGAPPAPVWHHHTDDAHRSKATTKPLTTAPKHEVKAKNKTETTAPPAEPKEEGHNQKSSSKGTLHFHFPHVFRHRHSSNCSSDGPAQD